MGDSQVAPEAVSLAAETASAPRAAVSNYGQIGASAELNGGGAVYLSRNRKAVTRAAANGDARPPVFVTAEVGNMQQSIPYRAIGTALVHDVIPMAEVIAVYTANNRADELLAHLIAAAPEDVALEVAASPEVMALLADNDDSPEEVPADTGAAEGEGASEVVDTSLG
jgi:hypothetical protein